MIFDFLLVVRGMFQVAILGDDAVARLHDALAVILEVATGSPRVTELVFVFVVKAKGIMAELVEDIPFLPTVFVQQEKVTVSPSQAGISVRPRRGNVVTTFREARLARAGVPRTNNDYISFFLGINPFGKRGTSVSHHYRTEFHFAAGGLKE